MFAVFKSQRKQKAKVLESRLYDLVERKEKELGTIDEYGRDLVLALRDQLGNSDSGNQRKIISEAERYLRENQHYY